MAQSRQKPPWMHLNDNRSPQLVCRIIRLLIEDIYCRIFCKHSQIDKCSVLYLETQLASKARQGVCFILGLEPASPSAEGLAIWGTKTEAVMLS